MAKASLDLDQYLRTAPMTCADCRATATVYPSMNDGGVLWCPNCSPPWLRVYRTWLLNKEREEKNLPKLMVVKTRILKRMLDCCSTDTGREVLQSVAHTPECVMATDTHIIAFVGKLPHITFDADTHKQINGAQSTKNLAKAIAVAEAGLKGSAKDDCELDVTTLEEHDGSYPNGARVVPPLINCRAPVYFAAHLLERVAGLAKAAAGKDGEPVVGLYFGKMSPHTRPTRFVAYNHRSWRNDQDTYIEGAIMPFSRDNAPKVEDRELPEDARPSPVTYSALASEVIDALDRLHETDPGDREAAEKIVQNALMAVIEGVMPTNVAED